MAFIKTGTMFPIASVKVLGGIDEWHSFKKQASAVAVAEAPPKKKEGTEDKKGMEKDSDFQEVATIDPEKFIYIHTTIMAGVKVADNGFWITPETEKYANDNNDAWTCDDLLKDYPSFRSATTFVEHDQNLERAKGKCIDAIARKMADTVLVDVLFSVDRRHKDLVANIESGIINAVSMGCSTEKTMCSICGNESKDPSQYCSHIRMGNKGRSFRTDDGKVRRAVEICKNNRFFDVSVVANPAFAGAVFRKILSSTDNSEVSRHLLANILTSKIESGLMGQDNMMKAASADSPVQIHVTPTGTILVASGDAEYTIHDALEPEQIELFKNLKAEKKEDDVSCSVLERMFGRKEAGTEAHPIERIDTVDVTIPYNSYAPIPGSVIPGNVPDVPVEIVFSASVDQMKKTSRTDMFKCMSCEYEGEAWQVKAASIDAGHDQSLVCPECGFIHEANLSKESIALADKQHMKDLGFSDSDVKKMKPDAIKLIILKSVTKKEYEKDPNVVMRKAFVVKEDMPVDADDGTYWFNPNGSSIIAKGEKLKWVANVDDDSVAVYQTAENEEVYIPRK